MHAFTSFNAENESRWSAWYNVGHVPVSKVLFAPSSIRRCFWNVHDMIWMWNTLLAHDSHVENGANGFRVKIKRMRESSTKLSGTIIVWYHSQQGCHHVGCVQEQWHRWGPCGRKLKGFPASLRCVSSTNPSTLLRHLTEIHWLVLCASRVMCFRHRSRSHRFTVDCIVMRSCGMNHKKTNVQVLMVSNWLCSYKVPLWSESIYISQEFMRKQICKHN